jgi:DNA-binding NtrC family response regulator
MEQPMKKTIVLCTDSLLTHETLWGPLQSAGWETLSATNSREALGHCAGAGADLLLVDLDWPLGDEGDSCEVARQALHINPHLPIIIISGRKDLIGAVESLGVAAVAGKPIDVPALTRTAEELMSLPTGAITNEPEDRDVSIRHLAPNPEAFREALWLRASAPFHVASQPRHFGLNE